MASCKHILECMLAVVLVHYLWLNISADQAVGDNLNSERNKKCDVALKKRCNIIKDCVGALDEKDCEDSKFTCDMENVNDCGDVTKFEIITANEARRKTYRGPAYDHTLRTSRGHIAYFQQHQNATTATNASLTFPIFLATSSGVKGCFGFHLSMKSTSSIKVYKTIKNMKLPAVVYRSIDQSQWVKIEFPINHQTSMVTIETGGGADDNRGHGYVAVDDVFINRGECKLKAIPALRCHGDRKSSGNSSFQCKDGTGCLDKTFVCDMQKNCKDGSDERDCQSYKCPGTSQMILPAWICNGYPDCLQGEDEMFCVCGKDEYKCKSGGCVKKSLLCDGYPDCLDGSDEASNCKCGGYFCNYTNKCILFKCQCIDPKITAACACDGFRCSDNQCISQYKVCDKFEDCYDGSDERNCKTCKKGQVMCPRIQKCIQSEWICDGYPDCPAALDEKECKRCRENEFKCDYKHQCIPRSKRCDEEINCMDGSDEFRCVYINSKKIIEGYKWNGYYEFCSHLWSKSWFENVCAISGYGSPYDNHTFLAAHPSTSLLVAVKKGEFSLKNFVISTACPTKSKIRLTCRPKDCGQPGPSIFSTYIVGGDVTLQGQWPFVVSIFRYASYLCTGTIIHPEWVLTAAHCFTFTTTSLKPRETYFMPWIFKVRAGSNMAIGSGGYVQEIRAKEVHKNHFFDDSLIYPDIALIKLSKPLKINDHVRPACLPDQYFKSMQCYVLGWGITNIDEFDESTLYLRQAKMHLDLNTDCIYSRGQKNLFAGQMCLGYHTETVKPCHGDSGGPLMCKSLDGHWSVAGLVSSGPDSYGTCESKSSIGSIFTDVDYFRNWIVHTMSTKN